MNLYNKVANHAKEVDKLYPQHVRLFTALVGSQNYCMDSPTSDVDTKSVLLPATANTLFFTDKVSYDYHVAVNGRDELCAVKDVRLYVHCLLKQNPNFVETLFSNEFVFTENTVGFKFKEFLFDNRERIAHYDKFTMLQAMFGMTKQYAKTFEHHGCQDAKAAANVLRMCNMFEKYYAGETFEDSLVPEDLEGFRELKFSSSVSEKWKKLMLDHLSAMQYAVNTMQQKHPEWGDKDELLKAQLEMQLHDLFKEVTMQEETWAG